MRIRYGIDTHGHNDYLSGLAELAARQPVTVLGSAQGDLGYPHRPVRDGETIEMGEMTFEVIHTPATPLSMSACSSMPLGRRHPRPAAVGRGAAGGRPGPARPARLPTRRGPRRGNVLPHHPGENPDLPDHVEVFPTHVSGSLCGGNIGSRLSTTVGYERRTNAVLSKVDSTEGFVSECIRLDNLPAVPPYWRRMRGQNLAGVPLLGVLGEAPALPPADFAAAQGDGAVVVDTRSVEAFGAAHIPGAVNVGLSSSFATWAGTVIPEGIPVLLVLDRRSDLWEVAWQLLRIGYPLPQGWLAGGMMACGPPPDHSGPYPR